MELNAVNAEKSGRSQQMNKKNNKNQLPVLTEEEKNAIWEDCEGYGSKAWDEFWKDKDFNKELEELFGGQVMTWFGDDGKNNE